MAMDLTEARERMVVKQLERRGIKDARVLAVMRAVARGFALLIPMESVKPFKGFTCPCAQHRWPHGR
jgi:hypothetical protein